MNQNVPIPASTRLNPRDLDALQARIAQLQRKLAESGHRTTPQRVHILRALLETDSHPTAEAVWERVRITSPTTTLGTVYKTLHTLRDLGEVLELDTKDSRRHYDALQPTPHPHAICNRCGRIDDMNASDLPDLHLAAMAVSGYLVDEQHLTFYGICPACQQIDAR